MVVKYQKTYNLVDRYLRGDKAAGEALYLPVILVIQKYVYNRTEKSALSPEEKEEIISNTLLTSIEKLNQYTGTSSFSTFVIGIAKNKIKQEYDKHARSSKLQPFDEIDSEDKAMDGTVINLSEISLDQPGVDPPQVLIRKEQMEMLDKAFQALPSEYQQIIKMRLYNKVPVKQISAFTGQSVSAIDSLHRRAIKKYKENYKNFYEGATDFNQMRDIYTEGGRKS